ncbi:hypothetical protein ATPR_1798 [Acetobacter tropicalis NBRC 101654]|uniref:Uncharacterized protein n=2 Tax=Acetobacter tropicalis TaxID=104102 RepID=F7VEJ9_9PROT|nr:hypothetical protein ATPR_1798 [Acetobacter tropicalis NBRC 101654]
MGYDFYTGGKRGVLKPSISSGEAYKLRTDKNIESIFVNKTHSEN